MDFASFVKKYFPEQQCPWDRDFFDFATGVFFKLRDVLLTPELKEAAWRFHRASLVRRMFPIRPRFLHPPELSFRSPPADRTAVFQVLDDPADQGFPD